MFRFKNFTIDQGNKVDASVPCFSWIKGDIKEETTIGVAWRRSGPSGAAMIPRWNVRSGTQL